MDKRIRFSINMREEAIAQSIANAFCEEPRVERRRLTMDGSEFKWVIGRKERYSLLRDFDGRWMLCYRYQDTWNDQERDHVLAHLRSIGAVLYD